jgi:porin-like protein
MDMFGGLTKTSSRIAIAAALGLTLGGYAMSTPAKAADLGGDCCADLEERVAELEATTVRKGNKKVSVTLSGWVVKTVNWWDDGDLSEGHVGDKDADLTSRFAITGSATIAPGWSGGYNITVTVPGAFAGGLGQVGNVFGINSNQITEDSGILDGINTLYSFMYVKSDKWGTLNWGYLSPASDNPAVLADISGTVIESNGVWFEGSGFFLRPNGAPGGVAGLSALTSPVACNSGIGNIGVDCYGGPESGVRYDTPTWGGFRAEVSWTEFLENLQVAPNIDVYDAALFYNGDWGNFKVSAAYSYTHMDGNLLGGLANTGADVNLHQVGATVMHVPSGLGIYGMYQNDGLEGNFLNARTGVAQGFADTNAWYVKPFIKRTWTPLGATVLFGEYGEYNDQFNNRAGINQCGAVGLPGTNAGAFCFANPLVANQIFITGTEAQRFGLGVVQEVDSAAMHLFARWQHSEVHIDFTGLNVVTGQNNINVGQGFDDLNIFQVGGIIFF